MWKRYVSWKRNISENETIIPCNIWAGFDALYARGLLCDIKVYVDSNHSDWSIVMNFDVLFCEDNGFSKYNTIHKFDNTYYMRYEGGSSFSYNIPDGFVLTENFPLYHTKIINIPEYTLEKVIEVYLNDETC